MCDAGFMKIATLSKHSRMWVVAGMMLVATFGFVAFSRAQEGQVLNVLMRLGEERVLEDGTRVSLTKGRGELIAVKITRPARSSATIVKTLTVREVPPISSSSTRELVGSYEVALPDNDQEHDSQIVVRPGDQVLIRFVRESEGLFLFNIGGASTHSVRGTSSDPPQRFDFTASGGEGSFVLYREGTLRFMNRTGGPKFLRVEIRRL
jgi:hypothetical protein